MFSKFDSQPNTICKVDFSNVTKSCKLTVVVHQSSLNISSREKVLYRPSWLGKVKKVRCTSCHIRKKENMYYTELLIGFTCIMTCIFLCKCKMIFDSKYPFLIFCLLCQIKKKEIFNMFNMFNIEDTKKQSSKLLL